MNRKQRRAMKRTGAGGSGQALSGTQVLVADVDNNVIRTVELGAGGGTTVARKPGGAIAGEGTDDAAAAIDPADALVVRIGDEDIPHAVNRNARQFSN